MEAKPAAAASETAAATAANCPCYAQGLGDSFVGGDTIPNNKKDALVNVKFDNLLVVENQKLKKGIKALGILFHLRPTAAF